MTPYNVSLSTGLRLACFISVTNSPVVIEGVLFFTARHGVYPGRVVYCTINIIYTKGERELGFLPSKHRPIDFEMREVVHLNPGNRIHFHVLHYRGFRHITHVVILVAKLEWNKSVETVCLILQITRPAQVINAMGVIFTKSFSQGTLASVLSESSMNEDIQPGTFRVTQ